jgi:starch phosphorylase
MVRDYVQEYYEPAAVDSVAMTADDARPARELAAWKQRVHEAWGTVRVHVDDDSEMSPGAAGVERRVSAHVDPGALDVGEIRVQLVHGPVTADGSFDEQRLSVVDMTREDAGRFTTTFVPSDGGRWGVTVRAMPTHPALSSPSGTGLVATA